MNKTNNEYLQDIAGDHDKKTNNELLAIIAAGSNNGGNNVTSVNGKTGDVVLEASDVDADASGSAAQALTDANTYTDTAVSGVNTGVMTITAGNNVTVDNTDPANPVVSATSGGGGGGSSLVPRTTLRVIEKAATVVENGVDVFNFDLPVPAANEYCRLSFKIMASVDDANNEIWLTFNGIISSVDIHIDDPSTYNYVDLRMTNSGSLQLSGEHYNNDGTVSNPISHEISGWTGGGKLGYNNTSSSGTVTVQDVLCEYYSVL